MLTECMLIRITTTNRDSAYQIFNSLNGRGTRLKSIDILKAEILSADIGTERNHIETEWQRYEDSLRLDKFKELFHHMFVIESNRFVKEETFVVDFKAVFAPTINPVQFFTVHFFPCARAMDAIMKSDIGPLCNEVVTSEKINKLLWMLSHNEDEQWIPVVIYYLTFNITPQAKLDFLKKMERCWAFHLLRRTRIDERKAFCLQLLAALHDNDLAVVDGLLNFAHIEDWKEEMKDIINSPLYLTNYNACRYLLLRLNCEMACEAQAWRVCDTTLSIEHILPRTLTEYWSAIWKTNSYKAHLHKIGNLTLLTRKINSQVQNSSFEEKKQYFLSDKHEHRTSSLPITTDIQRFMNWTVEAFKERQNDFCQRLYNMWELNTNTKTPKKQKSDVRASNTNEMKHATVKVTPKPKQKKEKKEKEDKGAKKEKKSKKRALEELDLVDETAQSEPAAKRQKVSTDADFPQFPAIQESAQLSPNSNNNNMNNSNNSACKSPVSQTGRKSVLQKLVENGLVKVGAEVHIDIKGYENITGIVGADGTIDGMHPVDWMATKLPAGVINNNRLGNYPWTKLRLKATANNSSVLLSSIKKPKNNNNQD